MAKLSVLDIMKTKLITPLEFQFDNLQIPPIGCFLSYQDIQALHYIATSVKLSSNIKLKYKMIDDIMKPRGFKRFSAGTNRVVYSFLEDTTFVVKIAVDKVGMQDNPAEFKNQHFLKPYVTKMFYISPCGTVGFAERVLPVKNKEEFRQIASDVFDVLINKILGKYVVEDIGTRYFMNYGVRNGYGPVLLDYPYVYPLDGKKLFCTNILPETGMICDGEIDYDEGFNNLICTRCGKKYMACELRDKSSDNKSINIKGGNKMKASIMRGNEVILESLSADEVMKRRKNLVETKKSNNSFKVSLVHGDEVIATSFETKEKIVEAPTTNIRKMNVAIAKGEETYSLEEKNINNSEPLIISTPITTEAETGYNVPTAEEVKEEVNATSVDCLNNQNDNSEIDENDEEGYEPVDQSNIDFVGDLYSSRSSDSNLDDEDDEDENEAQDETTVSKYEEYDEEYDSANIRNHKVITKGYKDKNKNRDRYGSYGSRFIPDNK